MGKKHADEMLFWTRQEFQTFIEVMKDRPASYAVFMTLYFTGIREGELLALTPSDIDFEKKTLTVNKSYQRLGREDIVTTPKTPRATAPSPFPTVFAPVYRSICPIATDCKRMIGFFPTPRAFCITKWSMAARHQG